MVIIYNKRTGNIKSIFNDNLQSIDSLYGDEAQDYKLILDETTLESDINVIRNVHLYKINIVTKELELK